MPDVPDGEQSSDQPIERPSLLRQLWYTIGGSLPARYRYWVLHDVTCRTWALRHIVRTLLIIAPLLTLYLVLMPASLSIRLLSGLTFSGGLLIFSLVNILVVTDRRAVRAGFRFGLVSEIRETRSRQRQSQANYQRRERIAARQARR